MLKKFIPLDSIKAKYLQTYRLSDIDAINRDLGPQHVTVEVITEVRSQRSGRSGRSGVEIQGSEDGLPQAERRVTDIINTLISINHTVHKPGEYLHNVAVLFT